MKLTIFCIKLAIFDDILMQNSLFEVILVSKNDYDSNKIIFSIIIILIKNKSYLP